MTRQRLILQEWFHQLLQYVNPVKKAPRKRTVVPCGQRVAKARQEKLLTQEELAEEAVLDLRTIQKVEGSRSVSYQTLHRIAVALSIEVETISYSPQEISRGWIESYKTHQSEMVNHIDHIIHPNVKMIVEGAPDVLPFSGEFQGIQGINASIGSFFDVLSRSDKNLFRPSYTVNDNNDLVIASGIEKIVTPDSESPLSICLTISFQFKDQLIEHIRIQFDTLSFARYLHRDRSDSGLVEPTD